MLFSSSATNGRPDPDSTETAPRRLDSSWYYSRIFKQPTDEGMLREKLHVSVDLPRFLPEYIICSYSTSLYKYSRQSSKLAGKFFRQNNVKVRFFTTTTVITKVNFFFPLIWKQNTNPWRGTGWNFYLIYSFRYKEIYRGVDNQNFFRSWNARGVCFLFSFYHGLVSGLVYLFSRNHCLV